MKEIRTVIVTLEVDTSEEYVEERLMPAIRLFPGVVDVTTEPVNASEHWAMENAKLQLRKRLFDALR